MGRTLKSKQGDAGKLKAGTRNLSSNLRLLRQGNSRLDIL